MANTKRSNKRKLISAIAMLTTSAVMLSTATYAWFTMNKEVEVTGLTMKTKVSGNLLICETNNEQDYSSDTLIEGRKALLEPVSSIDGKTGSFYYTIDANARGQKIHSTSGTSGAIPYEAYSEASGTALSNPLAGKIRYDAKFNSGSQYNIPGAGSGTEAFTTAYGYLDYVFYLKGTTDDENQSIKMTECNLFRTTNGASGTAIGSGSEAGRDIDRAWRIAVFTQDITDNGGKGLQGTVDPASTGSGTGILKLEGAQYFTTDKAVSSTTDLGNVNFVNTENGAVLATIATKSTTKYYKVTVRVWLEGEDDTCNSETYAALQEKQWELNCKFELGTETAAVKKINSDPSKTANMDHTHTVSGTWNDPTA